MFEWAHIKDEINTFKKSQDYGNCYSVLRECQIDDFSALDEYTTLLDDPRTLCLTYRSIVSNISWLTEHKQKAKLC